MTKSAQRDIDEARTQCPEFLGRQPAIGEGPRSIGLAEHVRPTHQAFQRLEVLRLAQMEPRRQFAMTGIVFLIADVREVRRSDIHYFGPCSASV
jgi:hypothetical protein